MDGHSDKESKSKCLRAKHFQAASLAQWSRKEEYKWTHTGSGEGGTSTSGSGESRCFSVENRRSDSKQQAAHTVHAKRQNRPKHTLQSTKLGLHGIQGKRGSVLNNSRADKEAQKAQRDLTQHSSGGGFHPSWDTASRANTWSVTCLFRWVQTHDSYRIDRSKSCCRTGVQSHSRDVKFHFSADVQAVRGWHAAAWTCSSVSCDC